MYITYVLYSKRIKKQYTGYTSDLDKRIAHHNKGLNKWTKRGIPWEVIYKESYVSKTDAIRREKFLKRGKGRGFLKSKYTI